MALQKYLKSTGHYGVVAYQTTTALLAVTVKSIPNLYHRVISFENLAK